MAVPTMNIPLGVNSKSNHEPMAAPIIAMLWNATSEGVLRRETKWGSIPAHRP